MQTYMTIVAEKDVAVQERDMAIQELKIVPCFLFLSFLIFLFMISTIGWIRIG